MTGLIQRMRFRADHRWSVPQMSAYLNGELDRGPQGRIERHLHDCPKCRELLRTLRATVRGLARIRPRPPVAPERTVAAAILANVRKTLDGEEGDDGRDV